MEEIHGGRLKAEDILHVLRDRVAELPGTRDRKGRPVIVFPARETSTPVNPDHTRNILLYLHTVTSDEYKEHGFVFVIDMRRGTTWNHVKPILKAIQEYFPAVVHIVLIIKPDNFWEKHKTSASSGKYKFEVQMISVENLAKYIEPSQLTRDFGGSLFYDHDEWLEMRLELEKLIWQMIDVRENFEAYRKEMENAALPVDVATAERATATHIALKKKIVSAPIDFLQGEVQRINQRISGSCNLISENGFNTSNGYTPTNPDLASALPHLSALVDRLRSLKEEIFVQWETRRQKLDHCYQLKLFEQDADKMFEWIRTHLGLSTQRFLEIGDSEQSTEILIAEHREFEKAANNTEVNVSHVMTVAKRLREIGNYGKAQIETVAMRLEEEWRRFKNAVDERMKLLELALAFHHKSFIYLSNFSRWLEVIGESNNIRQCTADELEATIAENKGFGENFVQIYAEAVGNGRHLTHRLKALGGEAIIQNDSYRHVDELIQRITRAHKELYSQWDSRRLKLHSRLALIAFETDTHLVLQWLEQHGDAYLNKNTSIGLNLSQAKMLQRNHSHFRSVASNTYSNAEKLFTASKTIIETGEGDARQMNAVVEELRRRIEQFSAKVEARRVLLDKSVLFHTHYNEIMQWYGRMEAKSITYEKVSMSVQEGEHRKEEWTAECDATDQAFQTTMGEGHQLVKALEQQARAMNIDNTETINVIEGLIGEIEQRHKRLSDTRPRQRNALQLAVRFAGFIADCKQIGQQLKNWQEDMIALIRSENFAERAERILPYQEENTDQVKNAIREIMNAAVQLNQVLDTSETRLTNAENVSAVELVNKSVEQLAMCQREVMQVAQETRLRIERCMQLSRARALATQTILTMDREEMNLIRANVIPGSLDEALEAQIGHRHFQHAIEKTQQVIGNFVEKTEQLIKAGNVDVDAVADLNEQVRGKWRRLVGLIEERNKLIKAAIGCYKTLHQAVLPILDQLEKEYSASGAKDWCKECSSDRIGYIAMQLSKHMEYKERFLKGCSYAQKTSELFLKYIRRCDAQKTASAEHVHFHEARLLQTKADLRERQQKILDLWNKKKKQLDCCHQSVLLEATAQQILDWINQEGEAFLKRSFEKQLHGAGRDQIDAYMEECNTFMVDVKQQRAKVRMLLEVAQKRLADETLDQVHGKEVENWMASVRSRFEQFSLRLNEYENNLFSALGRKSEINKTKEELSLDRHSDSSLESKIESSRLSETNRKAKEPMMELIKSERDYIDDLRRCIEIYLESYRFAGATVPAAIRNKEREIFSNIDSLYRFHSEKFLPDLTKYENEPEDVGYCFVFHVETLNALYTEYCLNKEQNNYLIGLPEAIEFFSNIREKHCLEHSQDLQSLVIKPVQRITRYRLMLEQLLKYCTNNVEMIKEAYDVVVSVPRRANDLMHLGNFDGYEELNPLGDFVMQETFIVWDPRSLFKKGSERQVFLFELCVVFAKKKENPSTRGVKYVYKSRLMLAEINVCEHVEGDPSKFALRQGNMPNNEFRTDLKAANEQCKVHWVKKIRELMQSLMTPNFEVRQPFSARSLRSNTSTTSTSDRTSKDSDGIPRTGEDRYSMRSFASSDSNYEGHNDYCTAIEDFEATVNGQLSVAKGQRLEILDSNMDSAQWVLVSMPVEGGEPRRGLVPRSILAAPESDMNASCSTTDRPAVEGSSSDSKNVVKRKSIRRIFHTKSSQSPSRPQSVSLGASRGGAASTSGNRLSVTDVSQPTSPTYVVESRENFEAKEPGYCGSGGPRSVLSTCVDQTTMAQVDPSDFDLPPPMSEVSSAVAGAAAEMKDTEEGQETPAGEGSNEQENNGDEEKREQARKKRQYVLMELVETERDYVRDLSSVVDGYMANLESMDLPDDLVGKDKIIFANIAQILEFHKTAFLGEIEKCLTNYEAAGEAFVKYERRLHNIYVKYCQNKPKSDYLVGQDDFEQFFAETKQKLGHKVALCDLLIKPVQRIMKYQLLLKDIVKYTERAGDRLDTLHKAQNVMHVVPKACDDMMQVGRLQNFDGNLTAQGKLIFQGTLAVSDNAPNQPFKGKDRRIFLFEQSAIIADCIMPKKEFGNPTYIFRNQIMVNKMILDANIPDEPLRFIVRSNDPAQPNALLAQANTMEEKEEWIDKINSQLDQQKRLLAALVNPKGYIDQSLSKGMSKCSLDGSGDKKQKARASGKGGKDGSSPMPSPSPNSGAPVVSPKHSQSKSSKLFGFGKKSSNSTSKSSPAGKSK